MNKKLIELANIIKKIQVNFDGNQVMKQLVNSAQRDYCTVSDDGISGDRSMCDDMILGSNEDATKLTGTTINIDGYDYNNSKYSVDISVDILTEKNTNKQPSIYNNEETKPIIWLYNFTKDLHCIICDKQNNPISEKILELFEINGRDEDSTYFLGVDEPFPDYYSAFTFIKELKFKQMVKNFIVYFGKGHENKFIKSDDGTAAKLDVEDTCLKYAPSKAKNLYISEIFFNSALTSDLDFSKQNQLNYIQYIERELTRVGIDYVPYRDIEYSETAEKYLSPIVRFYYSFIDIAKFSKFCDYMNEIVKTTCNLKDITIKLDPRNQKDLNFNEIFTKYRNQLAEKKGVKESIIDLVEFAITLKNIGIEIDSNDSIIMNNKTILRNNV